MTTLTTKARTWSETEISDGTTWWLSDDGRASVSVTRAAGGWKVTAYAADGLTGLDHPSSYIGSEPVNPTRADARRIARRWVKKLSRVK